MKRGGASNHTRLPLCRISWQWLIEAATESPPFAGNIWNAFLHEDFCVLLKNLSIQPGILLTAYQYWLRWWPGTEQAARHHLRQCCHRKATHTSLVQWLTMVSPTQLCCRHHSSPLGRRHIPRPQWVWDEIGEKREIVQYTLMHFKRKVRNVHRGFHSIIGLREVHTCILTACVNTLRPRQNCLQF